MRSFASAASSMRSPATNAAVSSTASWGLLGPAGVVGVGAGAAAVAAAVVADGAPDVGFASSLVTSVAESRREAEPENP